MDAQLDKLPNEGTIEALEEILANMKVEHTSSMTFITSNYEEWYKKLRKLNTWEPVNLRMKTRINL